MNQLHQLTIAEAEKLLKNREISSSELTEACLKHLANVDDLS